jgi:branched-chain amino acid aminotransferase
LAGTAAVLAPVGTLVIDEEELRVGDGGVGDTTRKLRESLLDLQVARRPDPYDWTLAVV